MTPRTDWIVDASNVMGTRPDGWWRDRPGALRRLVDEVIRWRHDAGAAVIVVADGYPTAGLEEQVHDGVDVRYAHSRRPDAADDLIVDIVVATEGGAPTVVTSDRRLRERVMARGAQVEGARAFLDRLGRIAPRQRERAILAAFGIDERALIGSGGEARVFALDDERVLRIPHPGASTAELEYRRRLLDVIARHDRPFAVPQVLGHKELEGVTVVVERRLPGRDARSVLAAPDTDRARLIVDHLETAEALASLPCPVGHFGEVYGERAIRARSFAAWATARAEASLRVAGPELAGVDAAELVNNLVTALPDLDAGPPVLVHLDAFLGNMLAERNRITAVIDFGPLTIGGPRHLDALLAVAYLASEITPEATDDDRAVARHWAHSRGLAGAASVTERWAAAYWAFATDDERVSAWCRRVLSR